MQAILLYYLCGGILLALLSVPLLYEKIPPNMFYGLRVPATLKDPKLWYAANKYAAQRLLWTGIATSAGALIIAAIPHITLDTYSLACPALFVSAMTVTLFQCFRYLQQASRSSGKE